MLKVFWDKDNIAFIGNQVNATEHSHCILQVFLSFDEPLQVTVENKRISGKCIIVNENARHIFSCDDKMRMSILIEPSSSFAKDLMKKMDGNYLICNNFIERIQKKTVNLIDTGDKQLYSDFMQEFAAYL